MPIEADNLTVQRLGRTVLDGVSLRIADGDCVSVIGPNGAGKSTLMMAMLGLLPAAGGSVRLDGEPLARFSRRQIARRIAYVPQIHDGYLGFRVRDVVESGRYAHLDPLEPLGEADQRAVDAAVRAAGIVDLLDRPVETLSGGERQKVWIAAAFAQESPTLFLDEPTSALDPAHQADLIAMMQHHWRKRHAIVVICHDLNLPLALGGRVLALRQGKIAFDEPVQVLEDTARLQSLFGTPFDVHRGPEGEMSVHVRVAGGARGAA